MSGVVSFDDLVPECDVDEARRFVQHMYTGREGYVIITRISSSGKHIVQSWAFQVPGLLATFEGGIEPLVADEGGRWNVYVSCAMHRTDPTESGRKRGGKQTIDRVHEVRLDLDLKEESFGTAEEIDAFVERLPIPPTLVVNSGIGAKHCYWILEEAVDKNEGETLNRAWWAMAQELADGVFIDHVHTADRIMRLPGTVRWPKEEGEQAAQVRIVGGTGVKVSQAALWRASEAAYHRAEAERSEVSVRARESYEEALAALESVEDLTGWDKLWATAHLEDIFNSTTTWDQILVPYGWKVWKSDYEGRRHWVRPGKTQGTSATTDYPPSPNVMTLFSNSAHRGLVKLDEADVTLTKFRVYAELRYDGDVGELAREIVRSVKGTGASNE